MTFKFFIINILNSMVMINSEYRILNYKINFKNYKFYLSNIILSLYTFIMYDLTQNFVRTVILLQMYILLNYFLFYKEGIKKIIFSSIINWITLFVIEIFSSMLSYMFFKNITILYNDYLSLFIIVLYYILYLFPNFTDFYNKIINLLCKINLTETIIEIFMFPILLSLTLYIIYFNISIETKLALFLFFIIEIFFLIYKIIKEKNLEREIIAKNEKLLTNVNKYEEIIKEYRISAHENKNQLLVIKGLANNNNEIIKYIDNLVKSKSEESLLEKVSAIPLSGLRGIIYYKLSNLDKNNYILNISNNIKKDLFSKIEISKIQDYYKIIGVFLDNSIESGDILHINIYLENGYLFSSFSNEISKAIDLEKIGQEKYSTKGINHGYGLQLVNKILKNNDFIHKTKINSNVFTQIIGIKVDY